MEKRKKQKVTHITCSFVSHHPTDTVTPHKVGENRRDRRHHPSQDPAAKLSTDPTSPSVHKAWARQQIPFRHWALRQKKQQTLNKIHFIQALTTYSMAGNLHSQLDCEAPRSVGYVLNSGSVCDCFQSWLECVAELREDSPWVRWSHSLGWSHRWNKSGRRRKCVSTGNSACSPPCRANLLHPWPWPGCSVSPQNQKERSQRLWAEAAKTRGQHKSVLPYIVLSFV